MAVERIVDAFPSGDKPFVSVQLANALKSVVCQRLLPGKAGGRVAAYEVLINTPAVANLIREEKVIRLRPKCRPAPPLACRQWHRA